MNLWCADSAQTVVKVNRPIVSLFAQKYREKFGGGRVVRWYRVSHVTGTSN